METAAYSHLNTPLRKREALALYYRLTGFLREQDPAGFGRFIEYKEDFCLRYMKPVPDMAAGNRVRPSP